MWGHMLLSLGGSDVTFGDGMLSRGDRRYRRGISDMLSPLAMYILRVHVYIRTQDTTAWTRKDNVREAKERSIHDQMQI